MVQDYAQQTGNKEKKKKHWWIVLACVVFILLMVGSFIKKYHGVLKSAGKETIHAKQVDQHQEALKKYIANAQKKTGIADQPTTTKAVAAKPVKPKFDFYTLLPKMKVDVTKNQAAAVVLKPGQQAYMLQFASVKDSASAQKLINELGASGVNASLEQFPINGETWYRVVSSPYTSQQAATQVQNQLREQNIDSLLIKLKVPTKPAAQPTVQAAS